MVGVVRVEMSIIGMVVVGGMVFFQLLVWGWLDGCRAKVFKS